MARAAGIVIVQLMRGPNSAMPVYQFAVNHDGQQETDVRWTHLPDEESARRFARLLIGEFVSSGQYRDWSRSYLEVRDGGGRLLLTIPFEQTA